MALWQFIVAMVGQNLLPCLFASAIIYAALSLLFRLGRMRRPADRTLFIYAGLFKAGLALWAGEGVSCLSADPRVFGYFALRLPNLAPNGPPFEPNALIAVLAVSQPVGAVLFAIALSATAMLCYRWARLAPLYRSIYNSRRVSAEGAPSAFEAFEALLTQAYGNARRLPRPKLMVVHDAPSPAFTMGMLRPIVVLSAELVSQLADRELRGIIAHELAHVRRLDYIGRWLATILRDVMFWNPFVLHWYSRLIEEQEAASDECAAELLGDPVAVASGLVEVSAHAVRLPVVSVGPLRASQMARESDRLARRVDRLEESAILRHGRTQWPRALAYVILVAFLMLQPHMVLPLADLPALAGRAFRVSAAPAYWFI
jgi:Zn-dependent protease with chaperone function